MRNHNRNKGFKTFLSFNDNCSYLYYKSSEYSIHLLAIAWAMSKFRVQRERLCLISRFLFWYSAKSASLTRREVVKGDRLAFTKVLP
jgi:hypothetical protein